MRRGSILAALALLVLVAVPMADAAVSKPLMTVEGNVIVAWDSQTTNDGLWRFELRTLESGRVEFGYFMTQAFTGGNGTRTEATIESVKFFTAPTGGKGAEFTGTECGLNDVDNATDWTCNDQYLVQVVDNAGRGVPDTVCGGTVSEGCKWPFTVRSGDIRIFAQQQR